ncbi:cation:proton antiporter [Thermococcus sp. LS1]|uniref:cation:proton antiporter n=1 Tax=Thermococcus sp. LS1 TaxID=1638259 RepID=UPI00143A1F81|nr:cation:proton antiporter [Thermococcus sp. LS1]NJD98595.1 cation:proton antiporter [Thermococcus sp. LS1]
MIAPEFFYSALIVMIGAFMALLRVFFGPSVPDRVVGVDTLNTLVVAGMILLGAAYDRTIYIDIAIVYALLSYIGTLAIARYLQGGLE